MKHIRVCLALALLTPSPLLAQEKWVIATSSSGSGPYIVGSAIANTVNEAQEELQVSAQSSGGYNNNLVLVAEDKANVGLTFLSDLIDAHAGKGDFAELPEGMFADLQRLFPVTTTAMHCVVPAASEIQSFADLKGRKLNINVAATSTHRANLAVIEAHGMSIADFQVFEIATSKSYDALADGVVDATCNFQPLPSSSIQQLAAVVPVRVLSMSAEVVDKVNAGYSGTMIPVTIAGGTYSGQNEAVATFAAPEVLFTSASADPELTYVMAKAFWDGDRPTGAGFGMLMLEDAAAEAPVPLHPGVFRYLQEKGLLSN